MNPKQPIRAINSTGDNIIDVRRFKVSDASITAGTNTVDLTVGAGTGDVVGPGSSTSGDIATWNGTDGTTLADGGMALPASSGTVGYLNIPQNSKSADYTCVAADSGKHILQTGASKTITIPANASVAYAIGTALTFVCTNASGCSIAITSDTMTLANSTTTGTRTLAQNGVATAIKTGTTSWIISGTGLT